MWPKGNIPWDRAQNASLNIQRQLTRNTVLDIGWTGDWGYNQQLSYDINPIPIGTRAPFNPANADPTNGGKTLPDVLLRTIYPGFNTINGYNHLGSSNYEALTVAFQQRFSYGLALGIAYTYSHALGLATFTPVVPNNHSWNYGNQSFDRPQNLQVNWSYQIPGLGKALNSKVLGAVVDRWTLSGIFTMQSGPNFNPGVSLTPTTPDYTGTPDVSARPLVMGNPMANVPSGLYYNPNAIVPAAFPNYTATVTTPALGDLGGGSGVLFLPLIFNWDATMSKFIPIFGERRGLRLQAQAYNLFNHAEFVGLNTGSVYNLSGQQTSLTAGTFSATLPARILAFSARFEF
jgi:hypothetical protein